MQRQDKPVLNTYASLRLQMMQRRHLLNTLPEKVQVNSEARVDIPFIGVCNYVTQFDAILDKEFGVYRTTEADNEWISAKSNNFGCPEVYFKNARTNISIFNKECKTATVTADAWTPVGKYNNQSVVINTEGNHAIGREIKGRSVINSSLVGDVVIDSATKATAVNLNVNETSYKK